MSVVTNEMCPNPTITMMDWIRKSDLDTKLRIFQILDTVAWNILEYNCLPSLEFIILPQASLELMPSIREYLSMVQREQLVEKLMILETLFPPQIIPLPILDVPPGLPALADLDPEVNDHTTYGRIQGLDHAKAIKAELLAANNQKGATAVPVSQDVPTDLAIVHQMKKAIFLAIFNMTTAIEKPGSTQDKKVKAMTNLEAEVLTEEIWESIINAQNGDIGIPGAKVEYNVYPTFAARHRKVVQVLQVSKCSVVSCMPNEFIKRLAAAPESELDRKLANGRGMKRKKQLLKSATTAINANDVVEQPDGSWIYRDGSVAAPPQEKNALADGLQQALKDSRYKKRKLADFEPTAAVTDEEEDDDDHDDDEA